MKIDQLARMLTSSVSLTFTVEQVAREGKAAESYATRVQTNTQSSMRDEMLSSLLYGRDGPEIDKERERQNGRRRTKRVRGRIVLLRPAPSGVALKISPSTQPHSIPQHPPPHPPRRLTNKVTRTGDFLAKCLPCIKQSTFRGQVEVSWRILYNFLFWDI